MKKLSTLLKSETSLDILRNFFFFLTLFSVIIDPTNTIFKIKNISFVIFVVLSIKYLDFSKIKVFLIILIMFFFSYLIQLFFPSSTVDPGALSATLKSFIFLIIIFLMGKDNKIPVFKYFFYINLFLAVLCRIVWWAVFLNPALERSLYSVFIKNGTYTMLIAHRVFLGIPVYGIFHKTCILSIFCLAYSWYIFLTTYKKRYLLYSVLFFTFLFFSTTRANMLSAIVVVLGSFIYVQYKHRNFAFLSLILGIGLIAVSILLILLLGDKGELSVAVKDQHRLSYWKLFDQNPLRFFLIGDGPGSTFYTSGFNSYVSVTELSYYELIRTYGFVFSIIFIGIFVCPLVDIFNRYRKGLFLPLFLSYALFLFVAGTNPYLIGSTGFISLAIIIYIGNNSINEEMNNGN